MQNSVKNLCKFTIVCNEFTNVFTKVSYFITKFAVVIPNIHIEDYNYQLPEERIAKYPLPERDASKLLIYRDGSVDEKIFHELPTLLPEDSIMVFNDTKVVPARMIFKKDSGAHIEIFCLEPVIPADYNSCFSSTDTCVWKCVIGNLKRWKSGILSYLCSDDSPLNRIGLKAELLSRDERTGEVRFSWKGGESFSNVLEYCGQMPIPPYLNRKTESIDKERYQTIYAQIRGSVAAPTAGLHFTKAVMDAIKARGINVETICLHVGAGTFLPVKSSLIAEHPMHREPFSISLEFLKELRFSGKKIIAVGTTSVRSLESLYYIGVDCLEKGKPEDVEQWVPYTRDYPYSLDEALDGIIVYLQKNNLDELKIGTRIIIVPGFKFRAVDMMITNFHQPESTLLLLVSAFVGGDWKNIYNYALGHDFRFLSYGDSSLLYKTI